MPMAKVAVTIDADLLHDVDRWVEAGEYANRSRAVQAALKHLRDRQARRESLVAELAKLDPEEEKALAEEWLAGEPRWPEY